MPAISLIALLRQESREFGISALFAAVVLFVASLIMLGRNVEQLSDSFAVSERSEAVLRQLDKVHMKLQGTEMTVRGYALSGDAIFLAYHEKVQSELSKAMLSLGEYVRSQPDLMLDYTDLKRQVEAHRALHKQLLAAGREEVAKAITDPQKRAPREAVLAQLGRMEVKQIGHLAKQRKAAAAKARTTFGLAVGIAIFAFIAGTVGFALTFMGRRSSLRRAW